MLHLKLKPLSILITSALLFAPLTYAVTVGSGNIEIVDAGGISTGSTILEGGLQIISNGGHSSGATLEGGEQDVYGKVSNTTVLSGLQNIYGTSENDTLHDGSKQIIYAGGSASGTNLEGGHQIIRNGGEVANTRINGGRQEIGDGGSATGTIINSGSQSIASGGSANDTVLNNGIQLVSGTTTNTTLNGGTSYLYRGASAQGYMNVNNDAGLVIYRGALAESVTLNGGTLHVAAMSDSSDGLDHAKVETLTMNGGNVVFGTTYHSNGYSQLNIGELHGTGNFSLSTSLADKAGNFITIGQGSGRFGLIVQDSGKEIADHTNLTVNLINDQGGDIDFALQSTRGASARAIDGGTYMYVLKQQTGKDGMDGNVWYLVADTEGNSGEGGNGGGSQVTTPSTDALLSLANAGLNIMRGEMDGLRAQRQGRSTVLQHGESNVWGHYLGKKSAAETSNGAAYKLYQNGIELGGDVVTGFDCGNLVTGAFVSLTGNNVKHARGGTSSVDSYGLGAYATWYDNSGLYLDSTLKANRLESQLSARMTNGDMTSGKWHQYGLSAALEAGYTFTPMDNLTVEPFARMTGTTINGTNVKLNNGMTAKTGKARSLTAEAGSRVATDFSLGNTALRPYLSISVEQELAHSNEAVINDVNRFKNHQDGTSGKYGAGLMVNPAKDVTLYGELNYRQGSYVEEPVQGMAGIRISF